ncbi:hypothetical protein BDV12DRAFT_206394 [Aspergillus spectabilis]
MDLPALLFFLNCQPEYNPWVEDPIAIIGIGLRLPGSVRTPQQYWEFLTRKGSGRGRVPASRYNVDAFLGPKGKSGHTCTEYGYFLEDVDLAAADSSFWSIPPKELELLDPQQRLMMEVVYECLESSGTATFKGKDIGCYVGVLGEDWMDIQTKDPHHSGMHRVGGYGDFAIANRVSKELGLTGPSMTIRTACSSSLMALHSACQAVYVGECSSAVVGGCNLILSPRMTVTMSEHRVISPTGNCRSFDAHADGYARGEAVNAIHIKRLSSALRDGDPIRAVIRSVCINSDGQRSPLFIPSPESHELLIRRSHQLAGITDLSQTAMIECHGTGTMVGDTLEGRAVDNVFGELGGILIGSVKPNIGHSEGASGLSSVIKMVLALENRTIPPNINFTTPNPRIPFGPARLRVPVECEPWPEGKAERVGLNGFGIGGANGHVLLESARSVVGAAVPSGTSGKSSSQLLVFSGTHTESVNRFIANTIDYISANSSQIGNACYTLACHRQRLPNRAFAVGSIDSWDISKVQRVTLSPDLVWVFTGQGSQYPEMGRDLIMSNAIARDSIQQLDQVLDGIDPRRSWSLHEELFRTESCSRLAKAEYSQPCCTAIQIAVVDVLASLKVQPSAVVGHSAGEIAAAYAVGALTAAEAITVAYHRGQVVRQVENSSKGGMMAVNLGREQVSPLLTDGVTIACENSPKNVTLSGDISKLNACASNIQSHHPDILVKHLFVNCAYHSAQMKEVEDEYLGRLATIRITGKPLPTVFVSSVTGQHIQCSAELGPEYWCRNLTSPVLFYSAISTLLSFDMISNPAFVEVGPHSVLSGPLRDIVSGMRAKPIPYTPTLIRDKNAYDSILHTAGQLFQLNASIDLSMICEGNPLSDLPPYPWHYEGRFWSESRVSTNWRFRQHRHHDILGSKIPDGNDMEPIWRSVIYVENVPWLREHIVDGKIVFLRAGYISMVGEAIRQFTGNSDFSLSNVTFLNELFLHENRPTELLTQFRPSPVNVSIDLVWYDFTITSYFGGTWTKLCIGQAKGGQSFPLDMTRWCPGPRKVDPQGWYQAMKRLGANHGPRFRGMDKISGSVIATQATAEVVDMREKHESFYAIHPCTIESIFQLFGVAKVKGIRRHLTDIAVPTFIGEIYICPSSSTIAAQALVHGTAENSFSGNAAGFCGEKLVCAFRNTRLSPITGNRDGHGSDPHAGARLVWQPDLDEVDITSLIRPTSDISDSIFLVEELALACMIESEYQTRNITPSAPHYVNFHEWLRTQRQQAEQGEYNHVPSCQRIAAMSSTERKSHIERLHQTVLGTDARYAATAIIRIYQHSTALFHGQADSLSLLLKDDLLTAIYHLAQLCDFADFFRVFAHNRPWIRVLEIGAGTGGVTATILPALQGPHGERMYDSYTYTDISPGFFDAAQERFSRYDGVSYRPLDITVDPVTQGFDAASYDLIIASNVLHATPSLQQTLANVKVLLKPGGKLFLEELSPVTKWINYIMGTLPGWWLGGRDGRPWEPYISPERWEVELRMAGLTGVDAVIHDGHMNAHIISSVSKPPAKVAVRVTILAAETSAAVDLFVSILNDRDFAADVRRLGEELPVDQMIISLLELAAPQLHLLSPTKYLELRDLVTSLDGRSMLWVSRPSQVRCSDPQYAPTLGFLRTVRRELAATIATLELESIDEKAFHAAVTVAERVMCNVESDSSLDQDLEYVYSRGTLMVGRFYPAVVGEELLHKGSPAAEVSASTVLQVGKRGQSETLSWVSQPMLIPTTDDWLEVHTRAVGFNSEDLLVTEGILDGIHLGGAYAGVVERVGPGVKNIRVGDRVVVFASGTFATRLTTSEKLCARMARNLSWVEAATMSWAFSTALYSLIDVGRLKHGDNVLIHSAFNAVGLAAIQVCRIIGAQMLCTVDSDAEVDHLAQQGVPREFIFKLRDTTLLHDVLTATQGRGADVVLNSVSGELLHASWQCVSEFGIMVHIEKQDPIDRRRLALDLLAANRSFAAVNIAQLCEKRPEIIQGLLQRCMHHYALGELNPLPVRELSAENVNHALRRSRENTQVRQIAIVMPRESSTLPVMLTPRTPRFCSDALHVIVGGLGGLARSVSSWMCLNGARHFLFFSPSAGSKQQDDFVLELRAQGCRVDLVSGDISREEDVDVLLRNLDQEIPVAGIMQASMALEVTSLENMSFEQWQAAFAPKVQGTWNLHNNLLKYHRNVDYFLLFSSLSGLIGQTGHANYAAGNAFLDAFVQYRHSMGLPCSCINIGVMEDVGYVSNQPHIINHFLATSTHMLHEQDLLDAIQLAIDNSLPPSADVEKDATWPSYVSSSQICIGLRSTSPLDSPTNRISWRRDPRMALYHNLNRADDRIISPGASGGGNDRTLEHFLEQVKLKPEILTEQASATLLGQEIGKVLFNLMLREHTELDLDVPLASLGTDSLLAIKLRDWFRRQIGVNVTVVQILSSGSLRNLGKVAVENMRKSPVFKDRGAVQS